MIVQADVDKAIAELQAIKLQLDGKQKVSGAASVAARAARDACAAARCCALRFAAPRQSSRLSSPGQTQHGRCTPHHPQPQEYEKATGKVSSQSKEAFRAALVRG